ncbi:MAG: hydantoinase/oxoprolinase family protein [Gammaproteobacteria bacterium]|nr:hydantoinase/oxoprolinase family protein [Gammaproteobacteria bacterium]
MTTTTFLGIDAGGTFTDFVCLTIPDKTNSPLANTCSGLELRLHKILSTPKAPERAIMQGLEDLGLTALLGSDRLQIIHGSTVATNAVLEGNTARTAFITNYGFADLLSLGRQTRPQLYALEFPEISPPVAPELCLETGGRLSANGEVLESLDAEELSRLLATLRELKPQAVAINMLFSFVDNRFEKEIEAAIKVTDPTLLVSRSSTVLPVYREYERGIATWLNAALGPVVHAYLSGLLQELAGSHLQVMQSTGETIAADKAAEAAVHLLLSGPAGGLAAVRFLGQQTGNNRLISFDMGGTSTDVALLDGDIGITTEGRIGPYPMAVPAVDMHTIGAGGGSIAYVDSGGMLQVGPESAGADPGPACYGRGGTHATVTDANVVLGRLVTSFTLADSLQLDATAARMAVGCLAQRLEMSIEDTALGIIHIANEHMAQAIREISVNRGHDAGDFMLTSFGGAGGLHVCAMAEAMQMRCAMVPARGGVLSALGMLVAVRGRQFRHTVGKAVAELSARQLDPLFLELEQQGSDELQAEGLPVGDLMTMRSVELRYVGQSYTLKVPWSDLEGSAAAFAALHQQRYGYSLHAATEIVNLCVQILVRQKPLELPSAVPTAGRSQHLKHTQVHGCDNPAILVDRSELGTGECLAGPAVITEFSATTWVSPGWEVETDNWGNLLLTRTAAEE